MHVVCLIGRLLPKTRIEIYCGVFFKNRINLFKSVNSYQKINLALFLFYHCLKEIQVYKRISYNG